MCMSGTPTVYLGWARPSLQAKKSICCGTSIGTHYAEIALQFLQPLMGFSRIWRSYLTAKP
jgi:hypothetical protein